MRTEGLENEGESKQKIGVLLLVRGSGHIQRLMRMREGEQIFELRTSTKKLGVQEWKA